MQSYTMPLVGSSGHYLKLIEGATGIRRHIDLLQWLQGDVQQCLPHDILLAGWGNFQEGTLSHDIVSVLPGVRSYAAGTDGLPFLLSKFYESWVEGGREPNGVDLRNFK